MGKQGGWEEDATLEVVGAGCDCPPHHPLTAPHLARPEGRAALRGCPHHHHSLQHHHPVKTPEGLIGPGFSGQTLAPVLVLGCSSTERSSADNPVGVLASPRHSSATRIFCARHAFLLHAKLSIFYKRKRVLNFITLMQ